MDIKSIYKNIKPKIEEIDSLLDELNELTIKITEIAAPPFKERKRAEFVAANFKELGYSSKIDDEGNVLAYNETLPDKPVILSAHLDTVFENEIITVERQGNKLKAPGIGDDSRGLANLLLIAKLLRNTKYQDRILFVATVGEEGRGDLRGVKYLFSDATLEAQAFVTIDGTNTSRIVDQGIGSLRYRLLFRGPGGHSYGSFGTVNPMYALGNFITKFSRMQHLENIISTHSLGVVGGGTSINAIPEQVWVDIDMRSETDDGLEYMRKQLLQFAQDVTKSESSQNDGRLTYELNEVGNRPAGKLEDDNFRNIITSVHSILDIPLEFNPSSTDANIPMNRGIPSISVAGVEESANAHTQDEWIDVSIKSLIPLKRNLLLITSICAYYEDQ